MTQQHFELIAEHFRETALLESTMALLEWDERTGLPRRGGQFRAEQITLLSGLVHRRKTDPRIGDLLAESLAGAQPELDDSASQGDSDDLARIIGSSLVRLQKEFARNTQLPVDLVQAISKATALGQQAWEQARHQNDWKQFESHCREIFSLRRQEAQLLQSNGPLYDALLDYYEEDARSAQIAETFSLLRDELVQLVQELAEAKHPPDGATWQRAMPVEQQRQISRWIAARIGYDFERGRLDETTHPFCTTLGPNDCRILTRYQESYFPSGFFGTLHEAGHGMYEQGLPAEWFGLPPGTFASLGVHESQSRLWENFVGRSYAFWQWCFREISAQSAAWHDLTAVQVTRDVNLVKPSLIRVEADEVTYNLHILIRFELEQKLLDGELDFGDAPQAWNDCYRHYLGIEPSSDREGILQDVHWSAGLIGYFPTYTLGNIYAAQLMESATDELGDQASGFARGEFNPLLEWLRSKIHRHGFCYKPSELIRNACGKELDAQPLVTYLRNKLTPLYGL